MYPVCTEGQADLSALLIFVLKFLIKSFKKYRKYLFSPIKSPIFGAKSVERLFEII
jgi:hypothetical protein